MADGLNNLADAASSVITLLSFKLCSKSPDAAHPYGYGRFEYVGGLAIAVLILLTAYQAGKTALLRLLYPESLYTIPWMIPFLLLSIAIKLGLAAYSYCQNHRLASPAIKTYCVDSLTDACTTAVVLMGILFSDYTPLPLDALLGLAVALLIFITGLNACKSNLDPLLGQGPDEALITTIAGIIATMPEIFQWHQLEVHDYGPTTRCISLHICCADTLSLANAHLVETSLQNKLSDALQADITIHLDPYPTSGGEPIHEPIAGRLPKDHFDYSKAAWLCALYRYRQLFICHQAQCFAGGAPVRRQRFHRF